MKTKASLAAFLTLLSCSSSSPPSADRLELESVERAWVEAGDLPDPEDCIVRTRVSRHDDYGEFKASCRDPFSRSADPRTLTGCMTWQFSKLPWRDVFYTVHIAPGNTHEASTIRHEACHVLLMCTGLKANGDPFHSHPRVWAQAGGATSVQAAAGAARTLSSP